MADNRILARIARQGGGKLLNEAIDRVLPVGAQQAARRTSLGGKLVGAALVRIATRSVPGAILVTGGLLAKALHERKQARRAEAAASDPAQTGDDTAPRT